jgi:hypothetical protein
LKIIGLNSILLPLALLCPLKPRVYYLDQLFSSYCQ